MPGSAAHAGRAENEGEGDVYMVDEEEGPGVWEVEHVLDADFGDSSISEAQTLSIEVNFVAAGPNMALLRVTSWHVVDADLHNPSISRVETLSINMPFSCKLCQRTPSGCSLWRLLSPMHLQQAKIQIVVQL